MRRLLPVMAVLAGCSGRREPPPAAAANAYVDAKICATCHAAIAQSYRETGMGRSFYRATEATMKVEKSGATLDHTLSGRSYQLLRRDGHFFLRRWQKGFDGKEANVVEAEIHYVMGSGNHARSYLHRTPQGRLAELPVAWYPEKGGVLAMSPGYDRPDHFDFRRKISTDCMFCHNSYRPGNDMQPASEPVFSDAMPEGIDCQRCHGPGKAHVDAGGRGAMVNPAKLGRERSLEICMQCHLETTSFPLPNSLVRFGRAAFSYVPGEPLGDFMAFFDHGAGTGRGEKFEIVSSVYRLRQSACFQKSGTLECITCHDPHTAPRGADAARAYSKACLGCHAKPHSASTDCVTCHMPKRRTEDVVRAVVTDHRIQRRAPADALKPIAERRETPGRSYVGEVAGYYPAGIEELYLAVAQVAQKSNLAGGIRRLEAAIEKQKPREPQFRFALAQGYNAVGQRERAMELYRGLGDFPPAQRNLGELLNASGRAEEAVAVLEKAPRDNSGLLQALGDAYRLSGRLEASGAALERAVALDPDYPEAHNSLGVLKAQVNDLAGAEAAFREAIRHQPDYAEAQSNLANVLAMKGDGAQAEFHYRAAIRVKPELAEAHEALGTIAAARGDWRGAVVSYREALRLNAGLVRAHLGLGSALAAMGDAAGARAHLERARESGDEEIRKEAAGILVELDGGAEAPRMLKLAPRR